MKHLIKTPLILFGIAALMVGGCSGKSRLKMGQTDEGEVVEAVGYAPYEPKNLIATKRASLTDAQRNAVEKAVGVYISAKAMVEQAIQIENNILAKTEGYVRKFDIVKEEVEGDLYKTTIRALVALKDLEADLKDMSLLNTPELERPRVRVVISEMIDKSSTDELPASRALESVLIEAGYKVVGEDRINDAELIIQGKASAHPFQSQGLGGFISYRARMTVQVVQPGTNDVIFSLSKEASGLGGSEELAALKSLETVGNLLGVELAERVETAWVKSRNLMVFVEGVETFEQVDRIKKHIQAQPGVVDLILRMYDEGMAQYEVQLGSIHSTEVASRLSNSKTVKMTVLETQPQLIRLKLN